MKLNINKNIIPHINKEFSFFQFNHRVLSQALNHNIPLLERIKFLYICNLNLDEFFEIKIGKSKNIKTSFIKNKKLNNTPKGTLLEICNQTKLLIKKQYRIFKQLKLSLNQKKLIISHINELNEQNKIYISNYFNKKILELLNPIKLDPSHPFPKITNKNSNFIIHLKSKNICDKKIKIAILPIPKFLPKYIKILNIKKNSCFISLLETIKFNIHSLFPQMKIKGCYHFRITRNNYLFIKNNNNLLIYLKKKIQFQNNNNTIRLEISENCPANLSNFLANHFLLNKQNIFKTNDYIDLNGLINFYNISNRKDLKFKKFTPSIPKSISDETNIFKTIKKKDILLHHPFESFIPILNLIKHAAYDPKVITIKQTLYRTRYTSIFLNYLTDAVFLGKQIIIIIEIRARFDEKTNIILATRLKNIGIHIVYGIPGLKIHSKMLMILRIEKQELIKYIHLSTGNYHTETTKLYTDYGMLTSNKIIGNDIHNLFTQLTNFNQFNHLKIIIPSPLLLQSMFLKKIENERKNAKKGLKALIKAKMNSLTDPKIIQAMYKASKDGVILKLIIRGTCCLRPGIKGFSENISVRAILGQFLEHTRVYYFYNNKKEDLFLASADLMTRNLEKRIEIAFPIINKKIKQRIIQESFDYYFKDNQDAWELDQFGYYHKVKKNNNRFSAQNTLLNKFIYNKNNNNYNIY